MKVVGTNQIGNQIGQDANDEDEWWLDDEDIEFAFELLEEEETLAMFRCLLCDEVITDATRVTKCMHLFCTGCVRRYVLEDGYNCCPDCLISLGSNPEEFLMFDQTSTERLVSIVEYFRLRRQRDELLRYAIPKKESDGRCRPLPKPSSVILIRKQMSHALTEGASCAPDEAFFEDGNSKFGQKNKKVDQETSCTSHATDVARSEDGNSESGQKNKKVDQETSSSAKKHV